MLLAACIVLSVRRVRITSPVGSISWVAIDRSVSRRPGDVIRLLSVDRLPVYDRVRKDFGDGET